MLQKNTLHSFKPSDKDLIASALPLVDALRSIVAVFRRQFLLILSVAISVLMCAGIFLLVAKPEYTARALLIIDAKNVQKKTTNDEDRPIDAGFIDSQTEILKSDNLAETVIKKLNLLDGPELLNQSDDPKRFTRAIRTFESRLTIRRIGSTYIIEISYRSQNADRAAQIANAVAEAYIADQLNAKYEAARRASVWLQERMNELHAQVADAETAIVNFRSKNNLVRTGGPDSKLVGQQQVNELNSQLVVAQAATADAKARLDRITEVLNSGSIDQTVTDTLKSELVSKLRSQYYELSFREADWSSRYGHDHLAAMGLRNQMQEVRKAIFDEVKRLAETYKSDFEIAKQREDNEKKELSRMVSQSQVSDSAQATVGQLESTAQSYKDLYTNFLQRYTESVQQQSFPISEARLISTASAPLGKSYPNVLMVASEACLLALMAGFGFGWLRDKSDGTFRTSESVEKALNLSCIALIPNIGSETNIGSEKRTGSALLGLGLTKLQRLFLSETPKVKAPKQRALKAKNFEVVREIHFGDESVVWTVFKQPLSLFSESLRSLKLSIDVSALVEKNKIIGFTSSLPNEGKSTVAMAMALLISQSGSRCVLVDCDLRNPTISGLLGSNASVGFMEVITGECSLDEALWRNHETNLEFLPIAPHFFANTADILASNSVRELFEELRQRYEYVIVDLSPVSPVVDVRATAHFVDSYIYVAEWGVTKSEVAQFALKNAPELRENILGVVLNKVDFNFMKHYGVKFEVYYNSDYHERYGVLKE
jgi:polysaccharide biosynthesis transport protein